MNEKIEIKERETGVGDGQEMGMSRGHALDLKLPIGWLLSAYGLLLGVYGLFTKKEMYGKSLGFNLNLVWGVLMLAIGGLFLFTAFLKRK
jgi:hypothetical protein